MLWERWKTGIAWEDVVGRECLQEMFELLGVPFFPQIAKLWGSNFKKSELPVRAFETGCWCWAPVLVMVL